MTSIDEKINNTSPRRIEGHITDEKKIKFAFKCCLQKVFLLKPAIKANKSLKVQ